MYKCPYCQQDSYAKSSKKKGKFESWIAVKAHTQKCHENNNEFHVNEFYGPIHYTDFCNKSTYMIRISYPKINSIKDIRKQFHKFGHITNYQEYWSKELIITKLKQFYLDKNRNPFYKELENNTSLPISVIKKYFNTLNEAIKAAGFEPDYNDGYGKRTQAKDKILYRSQAEAYFVNNYLYDKYCYEYERKYDNHNKYYDFYLPDLDLYIELDGALRPEIMQEKITINKQENKNFIVIKTSEIYNKKELHDFLP